ncbi:39S ribosomal protein L18 mitochondrial [Paragonimus skrjabini miyazakii]|uniref:Large ribosomal subunit protein uL18m n=1 Tax=Paragonimus skrjabini miyazakii TaxID=59628 RepID=A0A8S9YDI7_9TREM|nr:39S ribosomal protein L18 mitochondrial [Paragonimus skrjabini miyazakii]
MQTSFSRISTYVRTAVSLTGRAVSTIQFKNRNPRNLELLGLAPKRKGWEFQSPRKDYWHKVYLHKDSHHTTGLVIHTSSSVVVSASTREPSIQKHLYSCVDVSAAENIGRVLAYRCQQCGLVNLFFDIVETPLTNKSVNSFYNALLEGGICLQEPEEIPRPEPVGIDYDSLTESEKRSLYPSLIETLRSTPDWDNIPYPYSLRPKAGKAKLRNSYQILSKVRQGMVWDPYYCRMVLPQNKAHWQHEFEQRQLKRLDEPIDTLQTIDESVPVAVPKKWRLE